MLQSLRSILDFDPAEHDFNIPPINTKLNHLFMHATTPRRTLHDDERISHTIAVYAKIKQPELWAQWVREQMNAINNGTITNAQDFMNSAVLEYNHVCGQNGGTFNGSANTLTEDIVAMIATKQKKPQKDDKEIKAEQKPSAKKLPPFLKHFKDGLGDGAKPYKLGDTKIWNNETWYFCDCPSHRDKAKWHTHPPESCRTRLRWLAKKKGNVEANQVESVEETQNEDANSHSQPDTAAAMLSKVLQLAGDNEMAKSLIADALIALDNALRLCHGIMRIVTLLLFATYTFIVPWPVMMVFCIMSSRLRKLSNFCKTVHDGKYHGRIKQKRNLTKNPSHTPKTLFSVSHYDAILETSSMVLSAVRVPIQWCQPELQRTYKNHRRAKYIAPFRCFLLSALFFGHAKTVYAVPGTNHVMISGETSKDIYRQKAYVNTMVKNIVSQCDTANAFRANIPPNHEEQSHPTHKINQLPHCFVADTDSIGFVLDTGANRVIVNDASLFKQYKSLDGNVKGIRSNLVPIKGIGTIVLSLKSDDWHVDKITIHDAVYVPTSPYNLLPSQ